MKSSAKTVKEYLASLPDDRREAITEVRQHILDHLPKGFEEAMEWGMISYQVPLSIYPDTYNKKPLMYLALASQKNYMAIYMMTVYGSQDIRKKLEDGFVSAGKKLRMGGGCLRFTKLDDLELTVLDEIIGMTKMEKYVEFAKSVRRKSD